MAEFVMKQIVREADLDNLFEIASAATSTEELGNDMYPPAKRCLTQHHVPFSHRSARQITPADYHYYDYIVAMDQNNLRNLRRLLGDDSEGKISLLLDFTSRPGDVADPWYTGDFEITYRDVLDGCQKLLDFLRK